MATFRFERNSHATWSEFLVFIRDLGPNSDFGTSRRAIVTNVLGTGVFTKARVMVCNVGTPWMVLLAYPVVPALFFVASAYLMINTLIVTPLRALAGAVIVSAGLPVYLFHSRRTPPSVQGDTFSG